MSREDLEKNKSTYKRLWQTFIEGFSRFFTGLKSYFSTSKAILGFNQINDHLTSPNDHYLSDSKYAYRVFEYILIFLFLSKLFAYSADLDEGMEVIQEFLVLVFYFLELLVVIALGNVFKHLFLKNHKTKRIEAFFVYAFSCLFLPFYLLLYFGVKELEEEALDGLSNLIVIGSILFLWFFFFKMNKTLNQGKLKTVLLSLFMAIVLSIVLFLSLAVLAGADSLEA